MVASPLGHECVNARGRYGDECIFAHGLGDLRPNPPNAVALRQRLRLLKRSKSARSTHSARSTEPAARSRNRALLKSSMASNSGPAQEEPCPRRSVNQPPFSPDDPVGASVEQDLDRGHGSPLLLQMFKSISTYWNLFSGVQREPCDGPFVGQGLPAGVSEIPGALPASVQRN